MKTLTFNQVLELYHIGVIRIVDVQAYLTKYYGFDIISGL